MSDWNFLNKHRVSQGRFASNSQDGFNGWFQFFLESTPLNIIASDGLGWKHVSVSIRGDKRPPKWSVMCAVKDLFFESEDWVVQFHPAHSEYVNNHPGCLHLWKPTVEKMPIPESILVGLKSLGTL